MRQMGHEIWMGHVDRDNFTKTTLSLDLYYKYMLIIHEAENCFVLNCGLVLVRHIVLYQLACIHQVRQNNFRGLIFSAPATWLVVVGNASRGTMGKKTSSVCAVVQTRKPST